MSKNKFRVLIFMMLFSLTGIIWVQLIWIKNVVSILNENFDRAVIASLNDAANAIETNRKMNYFFENPLIPGSSSGDISGYLSIGSYSSKDGKNISYSVTSQTVTGTIDSTGKIRYSEPIISRTDTVINTDKGNLNNGNISFGNNRSDEGASRYQSRVPFSRNDFDDWVKKNEGQLQNMNGQMISEAYLWQKTMDVKNNEVDMALRRSFGFAMIETPFEFAVIKDGLVQDAQMKEAGKNEFLKSHYMVQLFPDNLMRKNVVLSVIFPQRTNYVLGSMSFVLGGSLLFSLIILATFALSLYFIIRQKKIADMKSDFLNNMTHEFKTPIATISLAADTITNPKVINDEASIRHFIGMIKKENSRMNKKVETILQIASLEKKEIAFKFENVNIHSVIERAADTIEIQVNQKKGKMTLSLNAPEPVIFGDYEHLVNLVNNLLDNALKYSPESPEIIVETKNNDRGVLLSVEDKGIGMSRNVQSKIFERFYRQTSGNVHDVKGFGLGLNYVRAIIDAHKGNVTVTSEPGKGSRFDIFLPFNWEN